MLDNIAFRNASPFVDAPAGVEIELDVAPATSTDVSESIYNLPVTLASREKYIVIADGITGLSATEYTPSPAFGLEIFAMAREAATDGANTDVLVHHGSTDAPTVDVYESSVVEGNIVDNATYTDFAGYLELATADYILEVRDETGTVVVNSYAAPLSTLSLDGAAITVIASGFLDPSVNGDGPAFGLWVATALGGELIPLPTAFVGVEELTEVEFSLYPNPVSNELFLTLAEDINLEQLIVTDAQGKTVINTNFITTSPTTSFDVSELENGLYFVNIVTAEGVSSKSFVKK